MKKVIYKYPLDMRQSDATGSALSATIELATKANILKFDFQKEIPTIWVLVFERPENVEKRTFEIYGTGWPIPLDRKYIGTTFHGPFVWHLFEHLNDSHRNGGTAE